MHILLILHVSTWPDGGAASPSLQLRQPAEISAQAWVALLVVEGFTVLELEQSGLF